MILLIIALCWDLMPTKIYHRFTSCCISICSHYVALHKGGLALRNAEIPNKNWSNVWTHNARWYRYLDSLIETNAFEISCLLCMSFCFVISCLPIWCKYNKLIIYLSRFQTWLYSMSFHSEYLIPNYTSTKRLFLVVLFFLLFLPTSNNVSKLLFFQLDPLESQSLHRRFQEAVVRGRSLLCRWRHQQGGTRAG